jgi:RsmE family RNA methyltransferase
MGLSGPPSARGAAVSRLLRQPMIVDEQELYDGFAKAVPFAPARWLIMDLGRLRFRNVDKGIPAAYREEVAGIAQGFQPDPFTDVLPSYHRFVFLYAVYDIALSFERSPLIGCTTLDVGPEPLAKDAPELAIDPTRGHVLLARAFDMETAESLDRDKVVYLVREPGRIPFASVGWPGFVGVVSGMNREGVAVVVHGGRAGTPRAEGMPVVFSLRETLATAHTTEEAVTILSSHPVLVSHIVIVTDASGDVAVVERAPGVPAFVRRSKGRLATTNHFEGPLASDPHDEEVRAKTSTLARRARADALLAALGPNPGVADMVAMLRDRRDPQGNPLPLGDRRAIDALIATHGVVFDATARALWVSEAPHLLGRFVRFDLARLLADDYDPSQEPSADVTTIAADPLLTSGEYELLHRTQTNLVDHRRPTRSEELHRDPHVRRLHCDARECTRLELVHLHAYHVSLRIRRAEDGELCVPSEALGVRRGHRLLVALPQILQLLRAQGRDVVGLWLPRDEHPIEAHGLDHEFRAASERLLRRANDGPARVHAAEAHEGEEEREEGEGAGEHAPSLPRRAARYLLAQSPARHYDPPMHRLPVASLAAGPAALPQAAAHYVARVLRARAGDALEVFDPRAGTIAHAVIDSIERDVVRVTIAELRPADPEPALILVQGYPKGDKLGDVTRDATELGATLVIPAICARSVARPEGDKLVARAARLSAIADEAARQCGRTRAPTVLAPMPWEAAVDLARTLAAGGVTLWERATILIANDLLAMRAADVRAAGVAFLIGPEGGLEEREVTFAEQAGFPARSMGGTILRTETAATAVLGAFRALT